MKNKFFLRLGLLLIASAIGFYFYQKYRIPPSVNFEKLKLTRLDGTAFVFENSASKKTVVNFFASWCGPCMKEMHALHLLPQKIGRDKIQVICITDESVAKIERLQQLYGDEIIFLQLQGSMKEVGVHTWPTTYVLDESGKIIFEKTGEIDFEKFKIEAL